jgi:hypothetical protein
VGASVEHVGPDNEPGDIIVSLKDSNSKSGAIRIVIEARYESTRRGRKQIAADIEGAMANRQCQFGLYISKTQAGLANEIGDWAEGRCAQGQFIACIADHVVVGLRFIVLQAHAQSLRASRPDFEFTAIEAQIERIRTTLRRVRTIKTKAGSIRNSADGVVQEADDLRREIDDALGAMEDAARSAKQLTS